MTIIYYSAIGQKSALNFSKESEAPLEPNNKGPVTAMSLRMRSDITSYGPGKLVGELHSQYLTEPFYFVDLFGMIQKMEEIFDTHGFPQVFLSPRTFTDKKPAAAKESVKGSYIMEMETTAGSEGVRCTFEITVGFRQNATWQGHILWIEKNIKQNFRSVLEMLKLMDEALNYGSDGHKSPGWHD